MKLVIDIPEEKYEWIKENNPNVKPDSIVGSVAYGIPYKERPHGEWTEEFDESANPFFQRRWRCSACNDYNYYGRSDFCPCCGADMREGEAE